MPRRTRGRAQVLAAVTVLAALSGRPAGARADEPPPDPNAVLERAHRHQSVAEYEEAAQGLERFAALDPRSAAAPTALSDAILLRLGLSQDTEAANDVATFTKNWSATRSAESAQLALLLAGHHAERGNRDKARGILVAAMPSLDRGPLDLQAGAHVLLARVSAPAVAKEEHARVRALWKDPAAAEQAIRRGWPAEDQAKTDRRLGRTLNAVGESTFAAAEERRLAEVVPVKLPAYTGAADRAAILTHVQTKVKDWFEKKRRAIELVEAEYTKVLAIRPLPPPKWAIASAGAVGAMWSDFADEHRRVPVAAAVRKDPELMKAYVEAVESLIGSIRARAAKPAMKKCVDLSVRYGHTDERSQACAAWLTRTYRTEYPAIQEIVPPLLVGAVRPMALPLADDGDP